MAVTGTVIEAGVVEVARTVKMRLKIITPVMSFQFRVLSSDSELVTHDS